MEDNKQRERQQLFDILKKLEIESYTFDHDAAPTCEEWIQYTKNHVDVDKVLVIKNLLLRDHKKKSVLIYIIAHDPTTIDLKVLTKTFGFTGSNPLRFVPPDILPDTLNVEKGHLTPFAFYLLSLDESETTDHEQRVREQMKQIQVLVDHKLFSDENSEKKFMFHPLLNTYTTLVSRQSFVTYLKHVFGDNMSKFTSGTAQVHLFDFEKQQKIAFSEGI